jgi:hypothetical protein
VVRGDQQKKTAIGDTYAATLAVRSFRTFISLAARFDLELWQYDAVNAFVNADIDQLVFMRLPPGHRIHGRILVLNKALFGLRKSPLLWQKELSGALVDIGFKLVPHEPCCYTCKGVILFFYVDDIAVAFRKETEHRAKELMKKLESKFRLTGGNELQWFLGIEVTRDRPKRIIWLSQSTYIDKIANLADVKEGNYLTPMAIEELLPFDGRAKPSDITRYQKKIGSLLYAAVTTRADVAFAVSRLSRFMINPGPKHHTAADRVLIYLRNHRDWGLQYGGSDELVVYSDASFADNVLDRKSSQAYTMHLFGGLIGWRANKQATVTTSTTEAELLALSQATKESLYVGRLLKELAVRLDDEKIPIKCDNLQTIRLVTDDIARLQTKLRHVDIHNHWLRQEVRNNRITVEYVPSKDMIADGLTKALSKEAFARFKTQINMVNISHRIEERRSIEMQKELDIESILRPME